MNLAIGIWRTIDEDKLFPALGFDPNLPVEILFVPVFRHFWFALR
jgi:hypothetical protein